MKLLAVRVTAPGKAFSMLFYNFVMLPLLPGVMAFPPVKWIYHFLFDRIFSFAIEKGIITYNVILIESIVDEEVVEYLRVFKKAKDLPKDATKEQINEVANELFDVAEQLISNRKPDSLLSKPT